MTLNYQVGTAGGSFFIMYEYSISKIEYTLLLCVYMCALRASAEIFRPTSPSNIAFVGGSLEEKFVDYVNTKLIRVPSGGWKDEATHQAKIISRVQTCDKLLRNIHVFLCLHYRTKTHLSFGCGKGSATRHYLTISISEHYFNPSMYGGLIAIVERLQRNVNSDLLAKHGWTILRFRTPNRIPEAIEVMSGSREVQADTSFYISPRDVTYSISCRAGKVDQETNRCAITFAVTNSICSRSDDQLADVQRALFRYLRQVLGDYIVLKFVRSISVIPNSKLIQASKTLDMLVRDFWALVEPPKSCDFCAISGNHALLVLYENSELCHACRSDDQMVMLGIDSTRYRGKLTIAPRIFAKQIQYTPLAVLQKTIPPVSQESERDQTSRLSELSYIDARKPMVIST